MCDSVVQPLTSTLKYTLYVNSELLYYYTVVCVSWCNYVRWTIV